MHQPKIDVFSHLKLGVCCFSTVLHNTINQALLELKAQIIFVETES